MGIFLFSFLYYLVFHAIRQYSIFINIPIGGISLHRHLASILVLGICLCLLAGCSRSPDAPTLDSIDTATTAAQPDAVVPSSEVVNEFRSYQLKITASNVPVYAGPGLHYAIVEYIRQPGIVTVTTEEQEILEDGSQITWCQISPSEGWVNLRDTVTQNTVEQNTVPPTDVPTDFSSYLFTVQNSYLPIYVGPGYHYPINDYAIGVGTYTITEESIQSFRSGASVTWGKLKSGAGWICLEDAVIAEGAPPFRCTNCGRADVYISRYGLCDPCHKETGVAQYGDCSVCGASLNGVEVGIYDGRRCFSCHVCDKCGTALSEDTFVAVGMYLCIPCYETMYCRVCGADCTDTGTTNGMCPACYYSSQIPIVSCQFCGQSYESWDTDDVCSNCEGTPCNYCGGPLSADHNCDDYPNVFCPNCDWSMHTTGVGTDGFVCPECGTHFLP